MSRKILIVLTSHASLGETGEKTGFWLEELAAPYYRFRDAGYAVTLASPKGGRPPLDPKSDAEDAQTEATKRFKADAKAQSELAATGKLSDVSAEDFDAVFYPGGHGPLWDLADDKTSLALIEAFWTAEKPVAAVCHGPVVLRDARDGAGQPLVRGRRVTAFSNAEEAAVGLTEVVPLSVEDALTAQGGRFEARGVFEVHAIADGRLITGQNPASSEAVADRLIETLDSRAAA